MPFDLVLLIRAPCSAASTFFYNAICYLGVTIALVASSSNRTSVSLETEATQRSVTANRGKRGGRTRPCRFGQVGADLWAFLGKVSFGFCKPPPQGLLYYEVHGLAVCLRLGLVQCSMVPPLGP